MANLTHSIDAAIAMETVRLSHHLFGVDNFNLIFDSFGTHAVDLSNLKKALLETVGKIFQPNLLEDLRQQMLSFLPEGVDLPAPPVADDWMPETVRGSNYFAS